MNFLKSFLLGILQGVTEWLPVSSTGHLLLYDAFFPLDVSEDFRNLFLVVIQLFSVCAIPIFYRDRLFPKRKAQNGNRSTYRLYGRVFVAAIPAVFIGFFFGDAIEALLYTPTVIAIALIVYGIFFAFIEKIFKSQSYISAEDISVKQALGVGCFQALALIPGTSRSGATVFGGRCLSLSRKSATEFSFFLSVPMMLGASGYRLFKYLLNGVTFTHEEIGLLLIGGVTAFLVSLITVRFLLDFVEKHSFRVFGYYRILLGLLVLLLFSRI